MNKLHIDLETYSSVSLLDSGSYKYFESPDFEILILAFAFDTDPVQVIDLARGEEIPQYFLDALYDCNVEKWAHNANFERGAFRAIGVDIPVSHWHCSQVKTAYSGLPLSLADVSKALDLGDKAKMAEGKALIKFFSMPCKPTRTNEYRSRNRPDDHAEKWDLYKQYCLMDVEAEREVTERLAHIKIPQLERNLYLLDQDINDRGILIDQDFAKSCIKINDLFSEDVKAQITEMTGLDKPNSSAQLKKWIGEVMKKEIKSLTKETIPTLLAEAGPGLVSDVIGLRQKLAKTSIKKYQAMLKCACEDGRAKGLFQFYGANRTGRWAGRLIQLQNLPQNHISDLDVTKALIAKGDYEIASLVYDNVSSIISQLIRTAFIAEKSKTFLVADFSAIEARVIAWLSDEQWRLDVFETHGKIYEASASMMFNVPIEKVTKGSDLRQKGKVAELALGYQGSVGALTKMGGERMGLSHSEMKAIVDKWREANPRVVSFWRSLEKCAKQAISSKSRVTCPFKDLIFYSDGKRLTIQLPSGRKLFYCNPRLQSKEVTTPGGYTFTVDSITYMNMDQTTKQWLRTDTYGGKLAENITQAVARDLLGASMLKLNEIGYKICMHVHDEVVIESAIKGADLELQKVCEVMSEEIHWAPGLPLGADGYTTTYYKKD